MTALELYNLPPPQDNVASLRQWRDKVNYVRNQIGPADRPEPRLLAKWLYDRVKKHPLMRRHVDKVRDAPPEYLTFDWLWGKLEQCLHESQQEANALSIQEALRKGPSKKPHSVQESSGLPASKGGKDGKGKGKPGKGDKDGKGKSKQTSKPTTAKTPELTATQKAEMPCIYFAQGKCFREKCPFKHDPNAKSKPAPKTTNPKPKPSPTRPGMVALLAASITAATATTLPAPSHNHFLEFVGDTGAGEWLGSSKALRRQGVQAEELASWSGTSSYPLRFTTGGGPQPATTSVGLWSQEFDRINNIYLLDDCPLVLSIGHLVQTAGFSFHWEPSQLPWLQSPEGECVQAHRIDHHVPIFRLQCSLQYGLPTMVF